MAIQLADRAHQLRSFLAMDVMERGMEMARHGIDVVPLAVGEPDFAAPAEVIEAATRALRDGRTHYTDSRGLRELREAIAARTETRRGVAIDPDHVFVTQGTSPALFAILQLLVNPGDEVVLFTPHYACYPNMIAACGGVARYVRTEPSTGFIPDIDDVRRAINPRTVAILVASPSNPTGAVLPRALVHALCEFGVPVLSDEIYDELVYDDAVVTSPLGVQSDCFVFDGFSKRYAMTGFRLGYVIVPPAAARAMQMFVQNNYICASEFAQYGGIAALEHGAPAVERMRAEYTRRRAAIIRGAERLRFPLAVPPRGAFYALVDARHLGNDSVKTAFRILETAHVSVGPGRDFGEAAEGFLRLAFTANVDRIEQGIERIANALEALVQK